MTTTANKQEGSQETKQEYSAGALILVDGTEDPAILELVQNNDFYYKKYGRVSSDEVLDIGPKGHIEKGEDAIQAAEREVMEEIGIKPILDTSFKATKIYEYNEKRKDGSIIHSKKSVIYFLAKIQKKDIEKIKLSEEISRYSIIPLSKAVEEAKFKADRIILEQLKDYLKSEIKK
jgi:8-oxo-dGTP pyrophosphatase MutT (NUDIX family)